MTNAFSLLRGFAPKLALMTVMRFSFMMPWLSLWLFEILVHLLWDQMICFVL